MILIILAHMNIPLCTFDLKVGEREVFEAENAEKYVLSASLFSQHDHENKPLYYYFMVQYERTMWCFASKIISMMNDIRVHMLAL